MLQYFVAWCGCTEAIHAEHVACVADVAMPALRCTRFDRKPTVGIAIFPCLPDPCWRGVSRSSRRRERLAPPQRRQGTWSEAYRPYPCVPQRHEEEETYHTACPAVEA